MKTHRHLAFAAMLGITQPAEARTVTFAIPQGPLSLAITEFSRAAGIQVMADPAVLRGKQTHGVRGRMTVEVALAALLRGTGLTGRRRGAMILIVEGAATRNREKARARASPRAAPVPAPAPAPSEAVLVVVGQRVADQRAIATKKEKRNIVDAISSDEVRRLPDLAIVDAMRRIPGVSVIPIADNEHPRDVPIAPAVRGLTQDYNNVTINGLPIASTGIPDSSSNSAIRGVRLDILPASMVSRLVVIKTFTPDLDPNAIGGAIDLQTRGAFENSGQPFVSAEIGLTSPSRRGKVQAQALLGGNFTLTASRTFGPDRRFGITVAANFQRLENNSDVHATSDGGFLTFYDANGEKAEDGSFGNGIAVPEQDKYWYNSSDRERRGVTARAEADLEPLRLSILAGDYLFTDGYTRNEIVIDPNDENVIDQTPTSGHFDSASIQVGYRSGTTRSETRVLQANADWNAGAKDLMTVRAGLSRSTMRERYDMVKFTAGLNAAGKAVGTSRLAFDYDTAPFQFSFNVPAESYYDLSLYPLNYWRHRNREAASRIDTLRADWQHNMRMSDAGLGFASGISWTHTAYSFAYHNEDYRTTDRSLTLAQAGFVTNAALPFNAEGLTLLAIDPRRAWAMFDANQASIVLTNTDDDNHGNDFSHGETIWSGYALFRYAGGPVEMLGGARLEGTNTGTLSNLAINDTWSAVRTSSRYSQLLPSLLVNYHPASALRVRAAYSRTIGRPSYEAYAPRSSIDFGSEAVIGDPDSAGITVVQGNPDIKPRLSDNIDLSIEWNLPRRLDGMVSAALFNKAIHHEIYELTSIGYNYGGVHYSRAHVTRPANATAAHISGLELSATIGSFAPVAPFLRHVGVNANWSLFDGANTVPVSGDGGTTRTVDRLVGQPSEIRNLAIFYNRGGFELRGAVNWTGKALRSLDTDASWKDVYWSPRHQFDMQARYHFGSGFSVILDIANISEERLASVTGPGGKWLKDSYSAPRTLSLSFHWSIGQ